MAVRKIGGVWYADWYDPAGKRRMKAIGSKRDAEAYAGKMKALIREGRYFDQKTMRPVPLGFLVEKYRESAQHKRGWETEEYHLKAILGHFGEEKLSDKITLLDVEDFQAARIAVPSRNGGKRSHATINREVQVLQRLMNKAVAWGMAERNPVYGVAYLEESAGRTRFLSKEEARALLSAANGDHLRPILVCALTTGMRRGEILSLRWDDVDFESRTIYVRTSKTGDPRHVPINSLLLETLQDIPRDIPYVFGGGNRIHSVRTAFRNACKKADIKELRFHDLRHTAASYMVMAGVPMKAVGEILGHSTATMTERYSHLLPGYKLRAVETLPRWGEEDGGDSSPGHLPS